MSAEEIDWGALLALVNGAYPAPAPTPDRLLNLVQVVEHFGVALNPEGGGWWRGLCPFHDDFDHQAFYVHVGPRDQRCGCQRCDFGRDQDVISFIMWIRETSSAGAYSEARRLLAAGKCCTPMLNTRPEP